MTKRAAVNVVSKKEYIVVLNQTFRDKLIKDLGSTTTHICPDKLILESDLKELLNQSSKRHLDTLKKLCRIVPQLSCSECLALVVEVLLDGLYYSNQNHSISSALNGVIRNLSVKCLPLAANLIDDRCSNQDGDNSSLYITWLAELLQSDFGKQALSQCLQPLISMNETLQKLLKIICDTSSAIGKVEIFSQIHLLTKTLLGLVKLHLNNAEHEHITNILYTLTKVVNLKDLPQEVLGNSSNILVFYIVSTRDDWFEIIRAKLRDENYSASSVLDEIDQTTLTKRNLCLALLAYVDCNSLLLEKESNETVLGGVILKFLLQSYEGLNDTTQALLAARQLEQWSRKCLECLETKQTGSEILTQEWLGARQELADMTSMSLEHQVDAVRHSAKIAFQIYIQTHAFLEEDVNPIIDAAIEMPRFKKSKYVILFCLAQSNLCSCLVTKNADLAGELLEVAVDPALASQAKDVYLLLAFHDMRQNVLWQKRWLYPLLELIATNTNGAIFESILIELLRYRVPVINDIRNWYELDNRRRLPVYISALLACKRQGVFFNESNETVSNDNSLKPNIKIIKQAVDHSDGTVRLNAIGIIVEGLKTTQLFSDEYIECMKWFITNDMNNSNPAFRQQLCAYVKKFLTKLRDGGMWLISRGENKEAIQKYRTFFAWFVDKCLTDLGPGSGFSRRYFSLQFLKYFSDIFGLSPNDLVTSSLFNLGAIVSLIDCLFDSYDVNKEVALELLCSVPLLDIANKHPNHTDLVNMYWISALSLSQSVRSASTSAATFLFRWMIHLKGIGQTDQEADHSSRTGLREANSSHVVQTLLRILDAQVNAARKNICKLAIDSPIYGLLSCVRHLLADLPCKEILREKPWNLLALDLIRLANEASAIASPVVTSDSPEGFLPADIDLVPSSGVSAQALLVSAWRTIKEVALLFGQLSSLALAAKLPILENEVIIQMGLHLKELLLETKHRGAFEQVYTGFSMLCNALWKSRVESLQCLPQTWLLDVIHDLRDPERVTKLCTTRRSAGLPFMFQAILSPEVEMGRGELFSVSLKALLDTASSGSTDSRLHCLNILRNLYRESRLNQLIGPYVAEGLMIAIAGFEASYWPERNSSTLLFTALMTRIFGVPRSKTDFQKKNSLTGRMFFQLYPQLYDFLLERLERAAEDIVSEKIHLHPSLFPVLVLVGRLQQPTGESAGSPFDLGPFVPLVRKCGASPVFKTRQLAAQALVPLLTPRASASLLPELIDAVVTSSSHNQLHGNLLQVHHFVKEVSHSGETYEAVSHVLSEKMPQLIYLLKSRSSLVRYEYASILELLDSKELLNAPFKCAVSKLCMDELTSEINTISIEPFYPLYCQKIAKLLVNTHLLSSVDILHLLDNPIEEVKCVVMEHMIQKKPTPDLEVLQPTLLATAASEESSRKSRSLAIQLLRCYAKNTTGWLSSMLSLYKQTSDDLLRCTILKAVPTGLFSLDSCDIHALIELSDYLLEATKGDVQCRHAAACAISQLREILNIDLENEDSLKRQTLLCNLWMAMFRLLLDDDEMVRISATSIVSSIYSDNSTDFHPVVAFEIALDMFIDRVWKISSEAAVTSLISLLIDHEELQDIESVAFEKEDNDSYWEPLVHSKLCCEKIYKRLANNLSPDLNFEAVAALIENQWSLLETADLNETKDIANRNRCTEFQRVCIIKIFYITASLKESSERIAAAQSRICAFMNDLPLFLKNYAMVRLDTLPFYHT